MVPAISATSQSLARELCRLRAPIGRPPGRVRGVDSTARMAARSTRWRRSGQRLSVVRSREATGRALSYESRAGPAPSRSWAVASPRPGGPLAAAQRSTSCSSASITPAPWARSEEHTSELQSHSDLVCRLLLEKKKKEHLHLLFKKKKTKQQIYN